MGSEQKDATSYQRSEPKLCANNCGFFGSACTEHLCSKCYRDLRVNEEQAASAKAAMEKSLHPESPENTSARAAMEKTLHPESWDNASAKAAMDKSLHPDSPEDTLAKALTEKSLHPESPTSFDHGNQTVVILATPPVEPSTVSSSSSSQSEPPKTRNRCLSCNKKVGLTGFVCKCGSTYCGTHRHPEKHDCPFDFKGTGRREIAKANPVVKADKVDRF